MNEFASKPYLSGSDRIGENCREYLRLKICHAFSQTLFTHAGNQGVLAMKSADGLKQSFPSRMQCRIVDKNVGNICDLRDLCR